MPTVCDILRKHEDRFASIEAKLASINLWDNMGDATLVGSLWEVGGDMIAVWSAATTRPLAWTQGQWARLRAGKIEARGDSFDFRSSDSGARIEFANEAFTVYNATELKARMGNLAGITDAKWGALSGWGFYAKDIAYLNTVYLWTVHLYGGGAIYGDTTDYLSYSPSNDEWWFMIGGAQKLVVRADGIHIASVAKRLVWDTDGSNDPEDYVEYNNASSYWKWYINKIEVMKLDAVGDLTIKGTFDGGSF